MVRLPGASIEGSVGFPRGNSERTARMARRVVAASCILLIGACQTHDNSTPGAELDCQPYAGTEYILGLAEDHVIILGEMHGTNESPDALRQLACSLLKSGQSVKIGLEAEWPQGEELNALLDRPFSREEAFGAAPSMWSTHDGRSSEAVYRLLEQLSRWKQQGLDISIFAFDAVPGEWMGSENEAAARDRAMAQQVDRQIEEFEGAVLLETGSFHAQKRAFFFAGQEFIPMASQISARPVLSLEMTYSSGFAWVNAGYEDDAGNLIEQIGPMRMSGLDDPELPPKSFSLESDNPAAFDGTYFTGNPTASPPAFPNAAVSSSVSD